MGPTRHPVPGAGRAARRTDTAGAGLAGGDVRTGWARRHLPPGPAMAHRVARGRARGADQHGAAQAVRDPQHPGASMQFVSVPPGNWAAQSALLAQGEGEHVAVPTAQKPVPLMCVAHMQLWLPQAPR